MDSMDQFPAKTATQKDGKSNRYWQIRPYWIVSIPLGLPTQVGGPQTIATAGKHTKNDGKSQFLMGKLTINGHVP
jgi:hypothetical protein